MTDVAMRPRPQPPESAGTGPGRGRLTGRRILIVGGGQHAFDPDTDPIGNGRALGLLCAREGAEVAVADVNRASAQETVDLITTAGGRGSVIAADVTSVDDVARMFTEAIDAMGAVDGLVFNVGIAGKLGLRDLSVEDWDNVIEVNLRGAMACVREGLDRVEAGSPIVMLSSAAAFRYGSQLVAYEASKAGLIPLMRFAAVEGSARGIRVNIVIPGQVDTPNGRHAGADRADRGKGEFLPFGRQATAWEVAYASLFFLSDESVYVTAQTLAVDSGITGL